MARFRWGIPVAAHQCRLNTVDEAVHSIMPMWTRCWSSRSVGTLNGSVHASLCVWPNSLLSTGSTYASLSKNHVLYEPKCHGMTNPLPRHQLCSPVWNHMLILRSFTSMRRTWISFRFPNNTDLAGDETDVTVGPMCNSFIWKRN